MDIKVNALLLKKCIDPCNALVGKLDKGFDLKYANIQLIVKNKKLDLYATDTSIHMHTSYGDVIDALQDINVSVPADNLSVIFSDITNEEDTVELSFKQKFLKVQYKKQQFTLSYFYNADLVKEKASVFEEPEAFKLHINAMYETVDKFIYTPVFTLDYSRFKQILSSLLPCSSKSPADGNTYGIYYDGNFYATNGYSFTGCYEAKNKFPEGDVKHLFFHKHTVDYLLKLSAEGEASLGLRNGTVSININNVHMLFKNNIVNFVPVSVLKSFIDKNNQKYVINTREITPAIKKVMPFSDYNNKCYGELTFKVDKSLHITVADTNKKTGFIEYIAEEDLPSLEKETHIGIPLDTIYAALQQITTDKTIIYYNSKTVLPLVFVNEEGTQYYYVSPTKITVKDN